MRNLYLLLALFFIAILHAQNPAALDLTFNFKDQVPLINNVAKESILQPDGKIIVIGTFTAYFKYHFQQNNCMQMLRLNPDLTIDETFSTGTGFNGELKAIELQNDGKILVGGAFTSYNGTGGIQKIVRLNSDGTLDPTFVNTSILGTGSVRCIKMQSGSKMLVGGDFINGTRSMLIRLNLDGSLDTSFTISSSAINTSGYVTTINPLASGKILAGGRFLNQDEDENKFVLFNSNGTIDATFNAPMVDIIAHTIIQPDNKILFTTTNAPNNTITDQLRRLNSNGSIDTSFSMGDGVPSNGGLRLEKPILQSNGDIVLFGYLLGFFEFSPCGSIRIHPDGTSESTFDYETVATPLKSPLLLSDGSIVGSKGVGMNTITEKYVFVRLDANGNVPDNQQLNTTTYVEKIYKKPNGEILVTGNNPFYAVPYHSIKLMDANGNLIYNPNLKPSYITGNAFVSVMQDDGKLIINAPGLTRLNTDYSVDTSFNPNFQYYPDALAMQADGRFLAAYDYRDLSGNYYDVVRRYSNTGYYNNTLIYGTGTNMNGSVRKVIALPDDKILIGGDFTSYSGSTNENLVKINANGQPDFSFGMPMTNGSVIEDILVQPDGKILISDRERGIFRLNGTDGSFDTSFNAPANLRNVTTMTLRPDGKILLGGTLSYNGAYGIAQLNIDGSYDYSFDPGIGFDGNVNSIVVQPDGKILVGGFFSSYNGTYCNGLIRLMGGEGFIVKGQAKFDSNNNGCDAGDIIYPDLKLNITIEATANTVITNTNGNYYFALAAGTYTITPQVPSIFTIDPPSFTVTFPSATSPFVQDFCLTSNGNHPDLEISIVPLNAARPGFNAKYKIIYNNKGNQLHSGSVTLNLNDAVIDLVTASPSANSQTTNNLTWNYTNLLPLEKREILLTFNLNSPTETPPLNSGSILNYTTTITSSLSDETPNDNTFTFHQNVVNSFDPNDKTCLEGATIGINEIGDYVHYMIRFENKGTYNAQNISVKDLIDTSKFDINTLTPINGSHLFVTRITEGNKVEFYFEDINLPFADATNDGYAAFKIKTKSTLVAGDSFSNTAGIYFDYNSAVDTNTATTTIQALAVQDFAFEQYFTVYPNPANNLLNIDKKENITISSLSVFNILGQQVMTIPNAQSTSTIDVSSLKTGNYFLKVNSSKGVSNTKFIKL